MTDHIYNNRSQIKFIPETDPAADNPESAVADALTDIPAGPLLVALSGGADSVALLTALLRLRRDIRVVHCNFHLRGKESDRDEAFCREICQKAGLTPDIVHFDTVASRLDGESVEMTCRRLRYSYFRRMAAKWRCVRIVTGHNADDNLETMLLNLARGAGIHGLAAMQPDNGEILRPLLETPRAAIETYLRRLGLDWITDSTNLESDYSRNFLRNQVVPLLTSRFPSILSSATRSLSILRGERRLIDSTLDAAIGSDPAFLTLDKIKECADPLSLLRKFTLRCGIGYTTLRQMEKALTAPTFSGKSWRGDGCEIRFERDGIHIIADCEEEKELPPLQCRRVDINADTLREMKRRDTPWRLWLPHPLEHYTVRHPRQGDRIRPLGMTGSTLLSDIMSDAHLPLSQRRRIRIVEDPSNGEIIWIERLKRSRFSLVNPSDKSMWLIESI